MAILIDAPWWARPRAYPGDGATNAQVLADGLRFAHLVSDDSRAELHAFVGRLDLPRRLRFHHDHYDVPAEWWDAVVASGATPVTTRELVRRLRSAGLRRSR